MNAVARSVTVLEMRCKSGLEWLGGHKGNDRVVWTLESVDKGGGGGDEARLVGRDDGTKGSGAIECSCNLLTLFPLSQFLAESRTEERNKSALRPCAFQQLVRNIDVT